MLYQQRKARISANGHMGDGDLQNRHPIRTKGRKIDKIESTL